MTRIAPSLLSCDFDEMGAAIRKITAAGADVAHLDVMDGLFVPNISFGIPVIAALRKHTEIPFDVHLMIERPERYIDRFVAAGADWVTIHYEATEDPTAALEAIRAAGKIAGLSIKPATPIEAILPILPHCDMILVMTVEPGFGGQSLIPECLDKVSLLKKEIAARGLDIFIEVDGGINEKTAALARKAGADVLVAGSSVFGAADMKAAIDALRGEGI